VQPGRTLGEVVELKPAAGAAALKAGDRLVLNPPAALRAGGRVSVSSGAQK